jgi:hypothetical protein
VSSEATKNLAALRRVNRAEYTRRIRAAMSSARGVIPEAARLLDGMSPETLEHWILGDDELRKIPRRGVGRPKTVLHPRK